MNNSLCKKVISMLSLYIENKLSDEDKFFVENHFLECEDCYKKYLEMKQIMSNLHFEYQKLKNEFECLEENKMFNIREYETFYKNISPYIDDELCYNDSIKFRKYLLKSKPARLELSNAYTIKNSIRNSFTTYKNNINVNYSKKIINKLKNENKSYFDVIQKRAAVLIGIMLFLLASMSLFMGFSYINKNNMPEVENQYVISDDFPPDDDFVEFTFDKNNEALLTAK